MTQKNTVVVFGQGKTAVEVWIDWRGLGAQLRGKITFEQWKSLLEDWKRCSKGWELVLADFLTYGKKQFGQEKVDEALDQLELDFGDTVKALSIGQLPLELRTENLNSDHYYVLAKADMTTKERGRWAAIAHKEKLSPMELQKSMEAGKVVRQADIDRISGHNGGLNTIQGLSFWFGRWQLKAGGETKILGWDKKLKVAWLAEVRPILVLADKVEKSL